MFIGNRIFFLQRMRRNFNDIKLSLQDFHEKILLLVNTFHLIEDVNKRRRSGSTTVEWTRSISFFISSSLPKYLRFIFLPVRKRENFCLPICSLNVIMKLFRHFHQWCDGVTCN